MKLRRLLSIFLLIMIWSIPASAFNFEISADKIIKSIQIQPKRWVITDHRAVFFNNDEDAKRQKGQSWPEIDNNAQLVLSFGFHSKYVQLEFPREKYFKKDELKKMLRALKLYKYNQYRRELGIQNRVKVVYQEKKAVRKLKKLN